MPSMPRNPVPWWRRYRAEPLTPGAPRRVKDTRLAFGKSRAHPHREPESRCLRCGEFAVNEQFGHSFCQECTPIVVGRMHSGIHAAATKVDIMREPGSLPCGHPVKAGHLVTAWRGKWLCEDCFDSAALCGGCGSYRHAADRRKHKCRK